MRKDVLDGLGKKVSTMVMLILLMPESIMLLIMSLLGTNNAQIQP